MKKYLLLALLSTHFITAFSQKKDSEIQGFDVNKMFIGGNIILGYGGGSSSSQFTIGANPEIGYSIYKNLDLGLAFNVVNQSGSYYDNYYYANVKYNAFQFGAGVFARIHITDGIFLHAQPEFNNIKYTGSTDNASVTVTPEKISSNSFLVGIGYGTRDIGNGNFFTLILIDLQNNRNSPYRNYAGQIIPQIRGGFNIYFGRKKKR